jgi:hypothetical protein
MKKSKYEKHLSKLQVELVYLQEWVQQTSQKMVVIFEGIDYKPINYPEITLLDVNRDDYQRPPHKYQRHIPKKFE